MCGRFELESQQCPLMYMHCLTDRGAVQPCRFETNRRFVPTNKWHKVERVCISVWGWTPNAVHSPTPIVEKRHYCHLGSTFECTLQPSCVCKELRLHRYLIILRGLSLARKKGRLWLTQIDSQPELAQRWGTDRNADMIHTSFRSESSKYKLGRFRQLLPWLLVII